MNLQFYLFSVRPVKAMILLLFLIIFSSVGTAQKVELIPNPDGFKYQYPVYLYQKNIVYKDRLYLQYQNSSGNYVLAAYDGTDLSIIPSPKGFDGNRQGYLGNPVVYQDKLYLQYQDSSALNYLVEFDGNALKVLDSPQGFEEKNSAGYIGSPIVFKDKLFVNYLSNTRQKTLVSFDGTNFHVYDDVPQQFIGVNYGYVGADPVIDGDRLYVMYRAALGNYLAYAEDSTLTFLFHPAIYESTIGGSGRGYGGWAIPFDGRLYASYHSSDEEADLGVVENDSLRFIRVPDSLGGASALQSTYYAGVFHDRLLLQLKSKEGYFGLATFKDSIFTPVASPPGFNIPNTGLFTPPILVDDVAYFLAYDQDGINHVLIYDGDELREIPLALGDNQEYIGGCDEFYVFDKKLFTCYQKNNSTQLAALEGETLRLFEHPESPEAVNFAGKMSTFRGELYFSYRVGGIYLPAKLSDYVSAVPDRNILDELKVYPNPARGQQITLELKNELEGPVQFQIFDLLGRQIRREVIQKTGDFLQIQMDVNGIAAGTYYVRALQGGHYRAVRKVVLLE